MKKKIIMGSVFAALLMLSMPMISSIQAQTSVENNKECNICSDQDVTLRPYCVFLGVLLIIYSALALKNDLQGNSLRAIYWKNYKAAVLRQMDILNCPNCPVG
jgi:hypothetical protein